MYGRSLLLVEASSLYSPAQTDLEARGMVTDNFNI